MNYRFKQPGRHVASKMLGISQIRLTREWTPLLREQIDGVTGE